MIRSASRDLPTAGADTAKRYASSNVTWQSGAVTQAERESRYGHTAAVLWFTGYSGAGKSTIAKALERALFDMKCNTVVLDGDNVRQGLCGNLGFTAQDRTENIRRVAETAKLFHDSGTLALCTFISPFKADRAFAKTLIPSGKFIEIFVKCQLDVCKRRDPKGLYKKAIAGDIADFTGVTSPYEEPESPDITLETDVVSVETAVMNIIELLQQKGIVKKATL
jgi:adenylyl-sulfate kinase